MEFNLIYFHNTMRITGRFDIILSSSAVQKYKYKKNVNLK